MNYYKRHLGDYAKKCGRLSMLQHGAYTLLLDSCYDREQFPTIDDAIEWTWASTTDEIEAVTFVLRKFFVLENGLYVQKRVQEELAEYREAVKNHWAARLPQHVRTAMQAERNAAKANATPPWMTKQDRVDIASVYAEAATKSASTGIPYDVDHIVPLRSPMVCGLHVAWNLRAIPAHENRAKSNMFEVA